MVLPRRYHRADVLVSLRGKPGTVLAVLMPYDEAPLGFLAHFEALPGLDPDELGKVLLAQPIGTTTCWRRKA